MAALRDRAAGGAGCRSGHAAERGAAAYPELAGARAGDADRRLASAADAVGGRAGLCGGRGHRAAAWHLSGLVAAFGVRPGGHRRDHVGLFGAAVPVWGCADRGVLGLAWLAALDL